VHHGPIVETLIHAGRSLAQATPGVLDDATATEDSTPPCGN
jgi:hypothetical protein